MEDKFYADAMLGSLARWMRVLGYDVEYERDIDDRVLVLRALSQGRIVLTRDKQLSKRRALRGRVRFIESDQLEAQLIQVVERYPIGEEGFLTRCLRCNTPLEDIESEEVKGEVPVFVFETEKRFRKCGPCGKIYWPGTHRAHMIGEIKRLTGRNL